MLGVSLVESFLACLHLLPKWRSEKDDDQESSLFWKVVCVLLKQLDQTPRHERNRENEIDPSGRCVQVRLGEKRIMPGINKGTSRAVQGRCTACRARNKRLEKRGRSPNTAWGCFFCHPGLLYFCKNKTCWAEHLRQVRLDAEVEFTI